MTIEKWRSTPFVFVEDLDHPELAPKDLHHYRTVRRIDDGDPITISDGRGRWRFARFAERPEPDGEITAEPETASPCTVGFAPVKGERPEWVVQKLTELGVDTILPLQSARSVVRWDRTRAEKQVAKWCVIAREASMQSRRVRIPEIRPVTALASITDVSVVLAEPGAPRLDASVDRTVLIGPEGGWSPEELRGQRLRSLPGGVLRAETAAIAAAVLLVEARDRTG